MRERALFIGAAQQKRTSFTSVCETFGISPKTGYKWLAAFEEHGLDGLRDRSRRPHGNCRALPPDLAERFLALRREHRTWGPRKLVAWLADHEPAWQSPAPSTVGELLSRHGLTRQRGRKRSRPPRTQPLRHATAPNTVWCMDFKGWFRLADGSRCDPLTITDAYSRFLLCCEAQELQCFVPVWRALLRIFREWGLPDAIRVDNQQPWVAPKGELGLTKLSVNLTKLGIDIERIASGKPQENGRHERFHLTLAQETLAPPALSKRAQQRRFDAFKKEYNDERPHEALAMKPPAFAYAPSSRELPSKLPDPEYPSYFDVRRLGNSGRITLRGNEYLISSALRGECIGIVEVEQDCFEIHFGKMLIGRIHAAYPELTLIPAI